MSAAHQTLRILKFGEHMAYQTLQIKLFEGPRLTKRYVYNGCGTHGSPNLHKYMGVTANGSPSVIYTIVLGRIADETIQIHYFEDPWLTQRYISKGLRHMAHQTVQIQLFLMFSLFSECSTFSMLS